MNTEILKSLLSRPIAFHASLARLTGGVNSGLLLSQGIYWATRTKDSSGWFWKTAQEWSDETALTRSEIEGARKRLRTMPFWREREDRYAHKLFFRVDMDALITALSELSLGRPADAIGGSEGQFDGCGKPAFADAENLHPADAQNLHSRMRKTCTRSTSEITSHRLPETTATDTSPEEGKALTIPPGAILPANGNDPWKAVKAELRKSVNARSWESWIAPTRLAYTLRGRLFVTVPSGEFGDWIGENFGPAIETAREALKLEFTGVEFVEGASGT